MERATNESSIVHFLKNNPAYQTLLCAAIEYCKTETEEDDLVSFCESQRTSSMQIQNSSGLIKSLVKMNALTQTIKVNDQVYEGSLEELQADEAIPLEANVQAFFQATTEGKTAVAAIKNELSFESQTGSCPERIPAFKTVLSFCRNTPGKSTQEIQEVLKQNNMLDTEAERGIDSLHASYFTAILEKMEALAWKNKAWETTEKGLSILNQ